jgi:hypothetical protein
LLVLSSLESLIHPLDDFICWHFIFVILHQTVCLLQQQMTGSCLTCCRNALHVTKPQPVMLTFLFAASSLSFASSTSCCSLSTCLLIFFIVACMISHT